MEKRLVEFVNDFCNGIEEVLWNVERTTVYVDSELKDYLDIEEVEKSMLDKTIEMIIEKFKGSKYICSRYSSNEIVLESLKGNTWGILSLEIQEELLKGIILTDGSTGNAIESGECIIDFENGLSISGFVNEDGEIEIEDNSKIYDSEEGKELLNKTYKKL